MSINHLTQYRYVILVATAAVGCAHASSTPAPTTAVPSTQESGEEQQPAVAGPSAPLAVSDPAAGHNPSAAPAGVDSEDSLEAQGEQPSFRRALAQTSLDATTTNGIAQGEFAPGARALQARIRVGGTTDLRQQEQTDACVGNMPARPQYIVNVAAAVPHLRFFTTGSGGRNDFAIAVGTPDGQLVCRDDAGNETTDPDLDLYDVAPGAYRVWVGDLVLTTGRASGVLTVTSEFRADRIDATAQPIVQSVTFPAGASAQRMDVSAGGDVQLDRELFGMCGGFATRAPTAVINLSAPLPLLRFFVDNAHDVDTTLLVHGPNDTWRCNDDSFAGDQPTVDLVNASVGSYQVWVGAYNEHESGPVRLTATTLRREHP